MFLASASPAFGGAVAERDPQARFELAHPEGLGHVVVGPTVERGDLAVLGAVGGEHDDGHVAPLPDPPAHLHAVEVGKPEIEDDDVGRTDGGLGDALLARSMPPARRARAR